MYRRIAVMACALVLAVSLGVSPASAATSAAWQSAGYYNSSLSCDISGANGQAQGRWTDYACVPTSGGLWLLLVNVP